MESGKPKRLRHVFEIERNQSKCKPINTSIKTYMSAKVNFSKWTLNKANIIQPSQRIQIKRHIQVVTLNNVNSFKSTFFILKVSSFNVYFDVCKFPWPLNKVDIVISKKLGFKRCIFKRY